MNIFAIVYGIGLITMIYLIYLIHKRAPKSDAKFYLLLLVLSAAIWIGGEFLYYLTWGIITVVFYCFKFVGIIAISYAILMATLTIPIRSKVMRFKYLPHILFIPPTISILLLFTNPFHHLFFAGFKEIYAVDGHPRYTGMWGSAAYFWHVPFSYLFLMWGIINIIFNIRKSRTKLDYYFLLSLFLAIALPVGMNVYVLINPNVYPDPTSLMLIFSAGQIAYVFSRYKVFQVTSSSSVPKEEKMEKEVPQFNIENGKSYIVRGSGYSLLKNIVKIKPVLVLTTKEPRWLRKYVGKDDLPVIWLSEVSSEFSILPERLEFEIEYTAIEFWRQNPGGVVVIDGVGYMSAFNSSDRLLMFLKDIIDVSSNYDGTLLVIGSDMAFMDDNKRKMIENIFEEKLTLDEKAEYGVFIEVNEVPSDIKLLCVSSENPEKACNGVDKSIWVSRGSKYSPDSMRIDVLYDIESSVEDGYNLLLNKPDGLFLGWKTLKIYTYLKLLADLASKHTKKVYVKGTSSVSLKKIISMFT